jgi:glutathione S-transferase
VTYRLWYWPGIPGRGEFVRLPLEAAGIAYEDCGVEQGEDAVVAYLEAQQDHPALAVPLIETGDGAGTVERIAQVANILAYLGPLHGFAPEHARERRFLNQVQLTIADMVEEVHNAHHPVSSGDYYENQKPEALRASQSFRETRIPKYLGYFEKIAAANLSGWLVGDRWSYGDTSLHHLLQGLAYAFPKRMAAVADDYPAIHALSARVGKFDKIVAYSASDRCQPWADGIFRYYPELDG